MAHSAQIGFAQNHGAGRTQPFDHGGVARLWRVCQRQRAGGSLHAVGCIDVVFDQDRNAMHRAAWTFLLPLTIQGVGDGERVGIGLDHRAQRGPTTVDGFDSSQVLFGNRARGELAGAHAVGEITNGDLLEILRLRGGGAYQGCGGSGLEKCSTIHAFDYIWVLERSCTCRTGE